VVYDLRGVRAARFQADERSSLENGWNGIRRSLPNGVYWIRSASLESAVKVVNGL